MTTAETGTVIETQSLEITFENAFDLAPRIYRFRPNSYNSGTDDSNDEVITGLNWGSVNLFGEKIEGLPPDTPKVFVIIETNYLLKSVRNFERGQSKAVSGAIDTPTPI